MTAPAVVLTDIEGTTTDIAFVHETLFPLSRRALPEYVDAHWDSDEILAARAVTGRHDAAGLVAELSAWIDADRKEPTLKAIQGKIWRGAFESGRVKSHVYADVPVAFRRWKDRGLRIAVFSSGSVEAQQLLFRHAECGDLTPFLSAFFDTTTGPKRESHSYAAIVRALGTLVATAPAAASSVLFLSDVTAELDAAQAAGLLTKQLLRPGISDDPKSAHAKIRTFDELDF